MEHQEVVMDPFSRVSNDSFFLQGRFLRLTQLPRARSTPYHLIA